MSNVKHKIFFGFKETEPIDGPNNPSEQTFYLLTEDRNNLTTEAGDKIMKENGQ